MRNLAGFLKASFANKVEIKGPCFAAAASFAQQIKSLARSLVAAYRAKMRHRFDFEFFQHAKKKTFVLFWFDVLFHKWSK